MQQSKSLRWPWVVVVIVVAAAGWWLFRQNLPGDSGDAPAQQAAASQAAASTPASAVAPAATSPPPIQHPVNQDAADAALPALADSDGAAWDALSQIVGNDSALGLLLRQQLIQRIVVMVDNLTQPRMTRNALALQPVPGTLQVQDGGTGLVITDANAQRYAPYVDAFTHADADALVGAYKRFYPMFQQAYVEIGRPDGYFNDRLVEVIDHLLAAPQPAAPVGVEPDGRGRMRFTDAALESLSAGQKALVRLGPAQEAAVKSQLTALRTALTRM